MYVTGTISDFGSRLHELGGDGTALYSFKIEGNQYAASVGPATSGQWDKEAQMQKYRISGLLPTGQFFNT